MHMAPLLVPPTSCASTPTNIVTSITHIVLGLYVSSSSQESLNCLKVALVAGLDQGCVAIL